MRWTMPFKIVRNDITKMECDAIVNTASRYTVSTFEQVGAGCDKAIHKAAGAEKLIAARKEFAMKCTGYNAATGAMTSDKPADMLATIDTMINTISSRITTLGAAQNRIESAIESIGVQSENITSSLSTLRDADVAEESSNYIKSQILQQASATLLATANQTPSIALNLL